VFPFPGETCPGTDWPRLVLRGAKPCCDVRGNEKLGADESLGSSGFPVKTLELATCSSGTPRGGKLLEVSEKPGFAGGGPAAGNIGRPFGKGGTGSEAAPATSQMLSRHIVE